MAPQLIEDGKIQIIGQTVNSVVYAVEDESRTGLARDSPFVLKGGTVWYKGQQALGPGKDIAESDESIKKEASIYKALDPIPKAWALRLERSPFGSLRDTITDTYGNPPSQLIRLHLAHQFSEGVAHLHRSGIIWGDLSTRNAFLFDDWRLKLGDFADSDQVDAYPNDWYGCEDRYCPPGSNNPQQHSVGTMRRELFALGSAIYEVLEWKVPYGSSTEVLDGDVAKALSNGKWPDLSHDNPAKAIIQKLWEYSYESSTEVLHDLQTLVLSYKQQQSLPNKSQKPWRSILPYCVIL